MKMSFAVSGLRELDAGLADLTKATARNVLKRVLVKAGQPIAEKASQLAPDDPATPSPDLHTSIKVGTRIKNKVGSAEFAAVLRGGGTRQEAVSALRNARRAAAGEGSFAEAYVGPISSTRRNAIKALVQEFGSVKQGPHAYMRPALESEAGAAIGIVKAELGGEIDKAAKRAAARAARKAAKAAL